MGAALGGFDANAKKIITTLEGYGWVFEVSSKGHAVGKAPDGTTTCSVARRLSRANRSQQNAEAVVKRWERHLEVQKLGLSVEALGADTGAIFDPVIDGVIAAGVQKRVEALTRDERAARDGGDVVSRKPWLARQGTSREKGTTSLYESHAVVEVTYADGTTEYECAREGCDYSSTNPRSVSSHFRAHVRNGEAEPVGDLPRPSVAKDVPVDPESIGNNYPGHGYTPTERLVKALAHALSQAGTGDLTALAYAALVWAKERPDLGDVEGRGREPLTDSEIVQRVRLLVGGRDPEMEEAHRNALATVTHLQGSIEGFEWEVAALRERLTETEGREREAKHEARVQRERADRLQADVDAWLSLAPKPQPDASDA
jgi:hypothetical protein